MELAHSYLNEKYSIKKQWYVSLYKRVEQISGQSIVTHVSEHVKCGQKKIIKITFKNKNNVMIVINVGLMNILNFSNLNKAISIKNNEMLILYTIKEITNMNDKRMKK